LTTATATTATTATTRKWMEVSLFCSEMSLIDWYFPFISSKEKKKG